MNASESTLRLEFGVVAYTDDQREYRIEESDQRSAIRRGADEEIKRLRDTLSGFEVVVDRLKSDNETLRATIDAGSTMASGVPELDIELTGRTMLHKLSDVQKELHRSAGPMVWDSTEGTSAGKPFIFPGHWRVHA